MSQVTAYIHPDAKIGKGTTISPFASIFGDVIIGDNCWIGPSAVIMDGSRIGNNVKIYPGAIISGDPQDLKYKGEKTTTEIGDGTTIREFATINKGTSDKMTTRIGKNCLIMAYVHIAHDCIIGDHVILANNVGLSGHINIHDYAIIEGMTGIQQFVTVGAHTFIAGTSKIRKNVPPYIRVAREPLQYIGVNTVGLTRRGYTKEQINIIEDIYRIIFVRGLNMSNALEMVEAEIENGPLKTEILEFIRQSKDGIVKGI